MSQTMSVRFLTMKGNKIMLKEEQIKRYKLTLDEYNLFRKDIIKMNEENSFHLILERFEKDDSITLEFSQENHETDILLKPKESCYFDIETKIKHMKKTSHFDVFVLWSDDVWSGKEQVFERCLTYEEMIKCIDYLLMKMKEHYRLHTKNIYPIHIRVE